MSQWRIKHKLSSHQKKVLAVLEKNQAIQKPGVHHVVLIHDNWCGILNGGECNCNPDINYVTADGRAHG
jgi:hypothetical protein